MLAPKFHAVLLIGCGHYHRHAEAAELIFPVDELLLLAQAIGVNVAVFQQRGVTLDLVGETLTGVGDVALVKVAGN